jgi:hypothetical protein
MCPDCEKIAEEMARLGNELWKIRERAAREFNPSVREQHLLQAQDVHRLLLQAREGLYNHQASHNTMNKDQISS